MITRGRNRRLEKGNLAGNSILRMSTQISLNTFSNKLRGDRVKRRIEIESEGIKEVKEFRPKSGRGWAGRAWRRRRA